MHENALWLNRLYRYKQSSCLVKTTQVLIDAKVRQRTILLKKYGIERKQIKESDIIEIQDVLLYEARMAKEFWLHVRVLLPEWTVFTARIPKQKDLVNQLLDIGYHHLTNKVKQILLKKKVSLAVGVLHSARTAKSTPLAYDLVELFRADIVDAEVLRFFRLKKKPLTRLSQKQIGRFLHRVNKRLEKKYYLKNFRQCHAYAYYMELQIMKFIKAVNHDEVFEPLKLPSRHDTRCS